MLPVRSRVASMAMGSGLRGLSPYLARAKGQKWRGRETGHHRAQMPRPMQPRQCLSSMKWAARPLEKP